jgi:hypothetical protein
MHSGTIPVYEYNNVFQYSCTGFLKYISLSIILHQLFLVSHMNTSTLRF